MSARIDGPVCILTAQDAAILWQAAKLNDARINSRPDTRVYTILMDIYMTALSTKNAATGNPTPVKTAIREHVIREVVTVTELAKQAGISPRTVRSHITNRTLPAIQVGREWTITRRDAAAYIAGRNKN